MMPEAEYQVGDRVVVVIGGKKIKVTIHGLNANFVTDMVDYKVVYREGTSPGIQKAIVSPESIVGSKYYKE